MGNSVFLLPSANAAFNRAQIRKLRETMGNGLLLDGPFADKNSAVADLAMHVKSRATFGIQDTILDTLVTLEPVNLPRNIQSSWLKIPFFLQNEPDEFGFRDCAGEIVRSSPIQERDGLIRKVSIDEIILVAVSTLRLLGEECYFAMFELENSRKMPGIVIPKNDCLNVALLSPAHFQDLSQTPLSYVEVLDPDALGSLLRIRSTFCIPDLIMNSLADGKKLFAEELETYAISAGHRMHEGKNMWTFDDVDRALESAISMFGPKVTWSMQSLRSVLQAQFVNPMVPGMEMLDELQEGMESVFEQMDPEMRAPMETLCNFIILMNSHVHPAQGCDEGKGGN